MSESWKKKKPIFFGGEKEFSFWETGRRICSEWGHWSSGEESRLPQLSQQETGQQDNQYQQAILWPSTSWCFLSVFQSLSCHHPWLITFSYLLMHKISKYWAAGAFGPGEHSLDPTEKQVNLEWRVALLLFTPSNASPCKLKANSVQRGDLHDYHKALLSLTVSLSLSPQSVNPTQYAAVIMCKSWGRL